MAPSPERSTQNRLQKRLSAEPSDLSGIIDAISHKACPICLCEIEPGRAGFLPLCRHAFCAGCIRRWSGYKRVCPLCKAPFGSSLLVIDLSSRTLKKTALDYGPPSLGFPARRRNPSEELRFIRRRRRRRACRNTQCSRTREYPRMRSFGTLDDASLGVIKERKLQWRESIYEMKLQAVPFASKSRVLEKMEDNNGVKAMVVQRIEPWIQRELEAILHDPNPSVIVHVATSLFVSTNGRSGQSSSRERYTRDEFLTPLRPFLHDTAELFWHELRCFAESPFSIETYDTVVEYKSPDQT
ncbi:unnamed protein product [Cuscuta campestris]|uniref:RING-type E3 ubiquitin transferase n=1 Tax=Cuscuta campestris TaxID=132261 RepID=A0A484NL15_9ASTE|nr:unnamed protein product [Cuscuta campestris]